MSLLDIKVVEIFVNLDGLVDPFAEVRAAKGGPLGGQLGVGPQQGVEAGGKGPLPPGRTGPGDKMDGDIHQAQFHFPPGVHPGQRFVQHRGIEGEAFGLTGFVFLLAQGKGLFVFQGSVRHDGYRSF